MLPGLAVPYRESLRWRGWPVELFAHGELSLTAYVERDFAAGRPVMARLCAEGVVLVDRLGTAGPARERWLARIAAGPGAPSAAALDRARYVLSDTLDDLTGATDPGEQAIIRWHVLEGAARLALAAGARWQGSGKWLLRELRSLDPGLAADLLAAREDSVRLAAVATRVLEASGGRLWEGYGGEGDPFHQRLHHVACDALSEDTAQSPGMRRLAAVSGATTGSGRLWMGRTHVGPGLRSADHHHGASETAIFVVSGTPSFVFLEDGEERRLDTAPGDYIFVPPYVPHREENPDPSVEAVVVIARSTQEAIVVNLPDLRARP